MDEIVRAIANPVFLVSSVLCGLLINIASNYLQRRLDTGHAWLVRWRGARSAARQALLEAQAADLLEQPNLVELYIAREARLWSASMFFYFLTLILGAMYVVGGQAPAGLLMTFARLVVLGAALFALIGGTALMNSAMQAAEVLMALGRARRAQNKAAFAEK